MSAIKVVAMPEPVGHICAYSMHRHPRVSWNRRPGDVGALLFTEQDLHEYATASVKVARIQALESVKFHKSASHVSPDFRDDFNATIDAAIAKATGNAAPEGLAPLPPTALAAARAFGAGLDEQSLEQGEVL